MTGHGSTWRTAARLLVVGAATGALVSGAAAAGAAAAGATAVPAGQHGSRPGLMVTTAAGALRGKAAGAVDEFLGIPYAAPPVGSLRWRPPQPAAPWAGVRDATKFAPHCPQPASPFGQASTSEDCLFLNVFTPGNQKPRSR